MIGFYNVSVILTYISLLAAMFGIFQSASGNITVTVFCLLFCGLCDMFDGKIARAIKRTDDEKSFGIQIDSLCDLICFGVQPAVICYCMGANRPWQIAALSFFALAAVVRLAYFNVTESARQQTTDANRSVYQGLPVTSIAILLPLLYIFRNVLGAAMPAVAAVYLFVIGALFVLNFKVRKPHGAATYAVIAGGAVILICLLLSVFVWA